MNIDIYFVNCFLACTLAFLVGYIRGKIAGFHRAFVALNIREKVK